MGYAIFLLMAMMTSVVGGYAVVHINQGVATQQAIADNKIVGNKAKALLVSQARYLAEEGVYALPAGESGRLGYTTLPSWMSAGAVSAGGYPFLYCPFSNRAETGVGSVVGPDASTYRIETVRGVATDNHSYVSGSEYQPGDLMGLIASPIGSQRNLPTCQDYVLRNGRYRHPDAQVWTINYADIIANTGAAARTQTISARVTPEATASESEGGLQSASMNTWLSNFSSPGSQLQHLRLYMQTGEYQLTPGVIQTLESDGEMRTLELIGDGPVILKTGVDTITLKNLQIIIDNVEMDSRIETVNSVLDISDSTFTSMRLSHSRMKTDGLALTEAASRPIMLISSHWDATGTNTMNGGIFLESGSTLDLLTGEVLLTSDVDEAIILLEPGSSLTANRSTVSFTNGSNAQYALANLHGEVSFLNTTLVASGSYDAVVFTKGDINFKRTDAILDGSAIYGIESREGGRAMLDRSTIFSVRESSDLPAISVADTGQMGAASGASTYVSGTECWSGPLFENTTATDSIVGERTINNAHNYSDWRCE